ncbi:MAG: HAD-IA family hydrolase [Sphingomonadales bacterium]|nr:HAD-IA family hydrolase [Sphingomonadales bacterium]
MTKISFDVVGFDLDGTLLDTAQDLGAALNHALDTIGRGPVAEDQVRNLIGGGSALMLHRALALTGGEDGIDFDALRKVLVHHYAANIAVHTRLFPGGEGMLDTLAERGIKLAVVTNKPEPLAVRLFDELGLTDRFAAIIGGGRYPLKPAPDALHAMVAACGGGRAAYVGDTTFDTHAARAATLPSVAVSFGFNDLPPDQLGADAVIDHFDDLIPALAAL